MLTPTSMPHPGAREQIIRTDPPAEPPDQGEWASSRYGRRALAGELERLERTAEGQRHGRLYQSARALGELVAGAELDAGIVTAELHRIGRALGLAESDVRKAVRRGLEHGRRRPRQASSPPINNSTDARAEVLRWWAHVENDTELHTRAGATMLRIFAAFALSAFATGSTEIRESYREIAELAGVSIGTIARHQQRHADLWGRHLSRLERGNRWTGSRSRWRLVCHRPTATPPTPAQFPTAEGITDPGSPLWHKWATGWAVARALDPDIEQTHTELAARTGLHPGSVRRILYRLTKDGIAKRAPDAARWTAATDAPELEHDAITDPRAERRERHRLEREQWQRTRRELRQRRDEQRRDEQRRRRPQWLPPYWTEPATPMADGTVAGICDEPALAARKNRNPRLRRWIQPAPHTFPGLIIDIDTAELAPEGIRPDELEPVVTMQGRLVVFESGEILYGGRTIYELVFDIAARIPDFDPAIDPIMERTE